MVNMMSDKLREAAQQALEAYSGGPDWRGFADAMDALREALVESDPFREQKMKKIVINKCHGGFGLSHEAILRYAEIKGLKLEVKDTDEPNLRSLIPYQYLSDGDNFWCMGVRRDDPALVQVVEEMGEAANDRFSELSIVEIPDDVNWEIDEYDGCEWVAEVHRTWG